VDPDPDWIRIQVGSGFSGFFILWQETKKFKKKLYFEHFYTFFICGKHFFFVLASRVQRIFPLTWPPFLPKISLKERNFVETIFDG
jgi:hypothetical protein